VGLVYFQNFIAFYFNIFDNVVVLFSMSVPNKTGCIEHNQENVGGEQGHQRAVTHLAAEPKQMRFAHCLHLKG